jgi:hypothetical protein
MRIHHDSLKLYRLTRGYAKLRTHFFNQIAEVLRVEPAKAVDYFDAIRVGIAKEGSLGEAIAFDHSRWVMINLTAKCFYDIARRRRHCLESLRNRISPVGRTKSRAVPPHQPFACAGHHPSSDQFEEPFDHAIDLV